MRSKASTVSKVHLQVEDEPDLLQRVTLLNTAFIKILTGSSLVRVISADYKTGCLDFLVECKTNIRPVVKKGKVQVSIQRVS